MEALQSCESYNAPQWKLLVESYVQKTTNICNDLKETKLWRAISYLSHEQKATGSWRQVPFIKMFIGNKEITYQSETITTAFVLKAFARVMLLSFDEDCDRLTMMKTEG